MQLHTLILINMGAILDLPSPEWFGDFTQHLTVHVIDSSRPQNLSSLFGAGEAGERIVIWDDGGAELMEEERKAWEVLTVCLPCISSDGGYDLTHYSTNQNRTQTKTPTWNLMQTRKRRRKTMKRAAQRANEDQ